MLFTAYFVMVLLAAISPRVGFSSGQLFFIAQWLYSCVNGAFFCRLEWDFRARFSSSGRPAQTGGTIIALGKLYHFHRVGLISIEGICWKCEIYEILSENDGKVFFTLIINSLVQKAQT